MARPRNGIQRVFIGHPFNGKFPRDEFKAIFHELPLIPDFGDDVPETDNLGILLEYLRSHIGKADYCLFDITYFNPNVMFELGLCAGLWRKGKPTGPRILLNTRRSAAADLPSDVQGVVRINYKSYDYERHGLGDQLAEHVFAKQRWFRRLWPSLPKPGKERKKVLLALRILGHLKQSRASISLQKVAELARDLEIGRRQTDWEEVLRKLIRSKLLKKVQLKRGATYKPGGGRFER